MRPRLVALLSLTVFSSTSNLLARQSPGHSLEARLITEGLSGFDGPLQPGAGFGITLTGIGDLDADGVQDIAVGAPYSDVSGKRHGEVWIFFLAVDGRVRDERVIRSGESGFMEQLPEYSHFGMEVLDLGDFDGDGLRELAVGASDWGPLPPVRTGGVFWLSLHPDGSVADFRVIAPGNSGFTGDLAPGDSFGNEIALVGDINGDGVGDLAVAAPGDDEAGPQNSGAVWILFMNLDGSVRNQQKINAIHGGFAEPNGGVGNLGGDVAALGDLDADGVPDLAVSEPNYTNEAPHEGAVWLLLLKPDGTVKDSRRLKPPIEGYDSGLFGSALTRLDDLDGDGTSELAVTGWRTWVYLMGQPGFPFIEIDYEALEIESGTFGSNLGFAGDWNDDGVPDLLSRTPGEYIGGQGSHGGLYLVALDGVAPAASISYGCGPNPEGSLVTDVAPALGRSVTFAIDNPLGTQPPGSLPVLLLSTSAPGEYPCGPEIPGFGMQGPGAVGELLIAPSSVFAAIPAPAWLGQAGPSELTLQVPLDASLAGVSIYSQAVLWDFGSSASVEFGLTRGVRLRLEP